MVIKAGRPRTHVAPTLGSKVLEAVAWLVLTSMWAYIAAVYKTLPNDIPIHFDHMGQPDGYGSKQHLLLLCAIGTVLFLGLTWLSRYPHRFNYPMAVTEENAARVYAAGTLVVRVTKLTVVAIFAVLAYESASIARGATGMGAWLDAIILPMVLLPVGMVVYLFTKK